MIAQPCVDTMDRACVAVCPVDCIHFEEGVDRSLYIDPDECIDCGACEPECPVSAIVRWMAAVPASRGLAHIKPPPVRPGSRKLSGGSRVG